MARQLPDPSTDKVGYLRALTDNVRATMTDPAEDELGSELTQPRNPLAISQDHCSLLETALWRASQILGEVKFDLQPLRERLRQGSPVPFLIQQERVALERLLLRSPEIKQNLDEAAVNMHCLISIFKDLR